ncbi:MAG: pyruvate dehydrogenase complex dihydrolipoamide acetyltransferase [Bacteroidota bacterium]|nr:pyruvate dehydrogenase complex dihydrolipoamide acetyltransferase [Bacteroidota bacterium]
MAEAIRMPRMSDTMTEGVIVDWHKKVGDKIKPGDLLADVETDKATMELESYNEGTLLYIGVEKGKSVPLEGILAIVGADGEDYKPILEQENQKGPKENKKEEKVEKNAEEIPKKNENEEKAIAENQEKQSDNKPADITQNVELSKDAKVIRMPLMSDTMTEGKIIQWNKKVGDKVKADDSLAEVETDKATMDVVGYEEGTLLYIGVEAGKAAKINDIIAIVGKEGTDISAFIDAEKNSAKNPTKTENKIEEKPSEKNQEQKSSQQSATQNNVSQPDSKSSSTAEGGRVKASPLAKKLAADKGIDISQVSGSGDGGRIIKKDVDAYVPAAAPKEEIKQSIKATETKPIAAFTQIGQESYEDIPNTQMRKTIARRLGESKFQAPHFYLTMEINMDNAISSRPSINEINPVKISFNDLVIKACAMALRQHPAVNSSWMGDFIRQNKHIHIGSAVAMPEGLIVPVIRFADQKSLSQIASEAKTLYEKARTKKLQPEDFSGNTFTISNLGMMDIEEFTAIINPPDSAILAVGRIKEMVVKKGDGFGVTNIMKVTLSCDHRSVDGAVGASFLQTVKGFLENPVTMLV